MLSSFTALNPEKPYKGRSNSPDKRNGPDKRKEVYDSRNQVIMVPGPTGKENLKHSDISMSPDESFVRVKKQLTMTNYIGRGVKDQSSNFLVKSKDGLTPSLFKVDNTSNAISSVPHELNDPNNVDKSIDRNFYSPTLLKQEKPK